MHRRSFIRRVGGGALALSLPFVPKVVEAVKVETSPQLAGPDKWHHPGGLVSTTEAAEKLGLSVPDYLNLGHIVELKLDGLLPYQVLNPDKFHVREHLYCTHHFCDIEEPNVHHLRWSAESMAYSFRDMIKEICGSRTPLLGCPPVLNYSPGHRPIQGTRIARTSCEYKAQYHAYQVTVDMFVA